MCVCVGGGGGHARRARAHTCVTAEIDDIAVLTNIAHDDNSTSRSAQLPRFDTSGRRIKHSGY
jgi:hypothetical protein